MPHNNALTMILIIDLLGFIVNVCKYVDTTVVIALDVHPLSYFFYFGSTFSNLALRQLKLYLHGFGSNVILDEK